MSSSGGGGGSERLDNLDQLSTIFELEDTATGSDDGPGLKLDRNLSMVGGLAPRVYTAGQIKNGCCACHVKVTEEDRPSLCL